MALSMLEAAANVRQRKTELDDICKQLRDIGADWTAYSIASEDAMRIADDGHRNCCIALGSIKQLALAELSRLLPNPGGNRHE